MSSTPPFAPASPASPLEPTRPASLATLTIRPPARSIIGRRNAWVTATTPTRLIATTPSQDARSVSTNGCVSSQPAPVDDDVGDAEPLNDVLGERRRAPDAGRGAVGDHRDPRFLLFHRRDLR